MWRERQRQRVLELKRLPRKSLRPERCCNNLHGWRMSLSRGEPSCRDSRSTLPARAPLRCAVPPRGRFPPAAAAAQPPPPPPAGPPAPAPALLPGGRGQHRGPHAQEVGGGQEPPAPHLGRVCLGHRRLLGKFAGAAGCGFPPPPRFFFPLTLEFSNLKWARLKAE